MNRRGEPLPRDPEEFEWSDHASDSLDDDMRYIDRNMAEAAIEDGREYGEHGGPGKTVRRAEFEGVDAVVVLATDYPLVVTAWTEVNDTERALASDRWSTDSLRTIRAFEAKEHKRA